MRLVLLFVTLVTAACAEPFDTTRIARPSRTLGQEIYNEVCNRVAAQAFPDDVSGLHTRGTCLDGTEPPMDASERLFALHAERRRFIAAIDSAISPELATDMGELLVNMLPLYDDGRMQEQTRAIADVLEDLAASQTSLAAFERMGARQGYKPIKVALGLTRPLLTYPKLEDLTKKLTRELSPSGDSYAAFRKVLTASHRELRGLSLGAPTEPSLLRDFLLREHEDFSDGSKRYIARRDARGVVEPARAGSGFIAPFADRNGDGLADVNNAGRLIDGDGRAVNVATPFAIPNESSSVPRDNYGRLTKSGQLVYEYLDASDTLAAGLLFETRDVLADQSRVIFDLVPPVALVLGGRETRQYTFDDGSQLAFDGFALEESPVLDLAHAGTQLLDKPVTYWAMRLAERMMDDHEGEVASLLYAMSELSDLAKEVYPNANLAPNNALTDDFLRLGIEIMREPGLLEDLLEAMTDPRTRALGGIYADYMQYKDRINYNPNNVNGPPVGSLHTEVNRDAADTFDNRSAMQRFLHLIHDCNGARMCNKPGAVLDLDFISYPFSGGYAECELFQIDNLATFYIEAVLGDAEIEFKDPIVDAVSGLDFMLEDLSGIIGFTAQPTPKAINRFVFAPRNNFLQKLVAPPRSADNALIEARHPGTIFAWELYGFFDHMEPLFRVFADHGRLDLLVDVMSTMHLHWSSDLTDTTQSYDPYETAYAKQSGIVNLEELIVRAFTDYDIINKIADVVEAARDLDVDGVPGSAILYDLPRQLLLPEWNQGLAARDGSTEVFTNDGYIVYDIAPAHLLIQAMRDTDAALDEDPAAREKLENALASLSEQALETYPYGGGRRFTDRRGLALLKMTAAFGRERLYDHWQQNDVTEWANSLVPDMEEALDHPLAAAVLSFTESIADNPTLRTAIESLLVYLVNSPAANDTFTATLTSLTDMLQLLDDSQNLRPLLKSLAPLFEPQDGALRKGVAFLQDMQEVDDRSVVPHLLEGLVTQQGSAQGETPVEALLDIVTRLNRTAPEATSNLAKQDYEEIFNTTRSFLLDDESGLERLYELIENR